MLQLLVLLLLASVFNWGAADGAGGHVGDALIVQKRREIIFLAGLLKDLAGLMILSLLPWSGCKPG